MSGTDSVRLARTSDVDDVADVQVRAWRASYAGILPSAFLDALDPSDIALEWGRALLNPGPGRLLVATDGEGTVVGAASASPSPDPDAHGAGEIGLLVVDPQRWGAGHGSRLLAACVDLLVSAGHGDVLVWIPLEDAARRSFLQSAGFGPDGAYRDLVAGVDPATDEDVTVREVRLASAIVDRAEETASPT